MICGVNIVHTKGKKYRVFYINILTDDASNRYLKKG